MRHKTLATTLPTTLAVSLLSPGLNAHHSNAPHYDRERPITIQGVVEAFEFVNPHAFLHIRAENEDGESVVWACEMQTANTLRRRGWTEDRFVVGQEVIVQGNAARRDPLGCSYKSGELADGTTIGRSGEVVAPERAAATEPVVAAAPVSSPAAEPERAALLARVRRHREPVLPRGEEYANPE